ncbi:hypothetical protein [Bacillus sp. FJAT-52991]|uniref:Uncharacterized protein n=1 Tax=Bacillus kandeliae TaxID=3129297 RepID=A0ABZ2NB67_9BACI
MPKVEVYHIKDNGCIEILRECEIYVESRKKYSKFEALERILLRISSHFIEKGKTEQLQRIINTVQQAIDTSKLK